MRRLWALAAALTLAGLVVTSVVWAGPDSAATVRFGNPEAGSKFPPPDGHDASSNAKDNVFPRTAVVARGGTVTYEINGFHQPVLYGPGTTAGDIVVPAFPPNFFVDSPGALAVGPPAEAGSWTTPALAQPGRYLIICNITPHFAFFKMYGWIEVK